MKTIVRIIFSATVAAFATASATSMLDGAPNPNGSPANTVISTPASDGGAAASVIPSIVPATNSTNDKDPQLALDPASGPLPGPLPSQAPGPVPGQAPSPIPGEVPGPVPGQAPGPALGPTSNGSSHSKFIPDGRGGGTTISSGYIPVPGGAGQWSMVVSRSGNMPRGRIPGLPSLNIPGLIMNIPGLPSLAGFQGGAGAAASGQFAAGY